jgi:putative transposase
MSLRLLYLIFLRLLNLMLLLGRSSASKDVERVCWALLR